MATLDSIMDPERNNFGLLRLSAAASVVISHAFYLATGDDLAQPLSGLTRYNLGQHAVHLFFVISGLTVAGSLDRASSLRSFALARVLRIVPGLAVCVLLTTFALGPWVSTYPLKAYFENPLTYLFPAQTLTLAKISGLLPGVFEKKCTETRRGAEGCQIMTDASPATESSPDPLARYRWSARVLVVLAVDAKSPALAEQRRHVHDLEGGATERDLVLVTPSPGSGELQLLAGRFGMGPEPFLVVLVGKDGGEKLRSLQPIPAQDLIATIDAMPMRQGEMRKRDC